MTSPPPNVISLSSADGLHRLEFQWQSDRFTHRVLLDHRVVAQSVEGNSQSPWPASPPIQQLSLESIDGKPTALGVGAAGRSYWSFSAQFTSMSEGTPAIRFDVAARLPRAETICAETELRSTYRLSNPLELQPIDLVPIDGERIDGERIDGPSPSPDWRCLAIRPHALSNAKAPTRDSAKSPITVCWSYLLGYPA
jgi:hypothetical protein